MPTQPPRRTPSSGSSGSKSPKHRGYRPEQNDGGAPKKRWTADDRAARGRTPDRRTGQRDERAADGRPDWRPFDKSATRRPAGGDHRPYGDRSARDGRPARDERGGADRGYGAARNDRSDRPDRSRFSRDDRPARDDRRSFGDRSERSDRPRFDRNDRTDRPARDDRSRGDRFDRTERPARVDRDARPARDDRRPFGDRSERSGRPRFDRNDRTDRPARDDRSRGDRFDRTERPARDDRPRYDRSDRTDRPARDERPRFDRDDRAPRRSFGDRDERPRYDRADRTERPRFDRDDRPRRSFDDRGDRPARDGDRARSWDDRRPARDDRASGGTAFYPERSAEPVDDVVLEKLTATAVEATDVDGTGFGDLGLGQNIVRVLAELGAASSFPIQAATIPDVLAGRDVLGRGRTGSGKTIAFGAPLVERLLQAGKGEKRRIGRAPRALIMAPTRELALQIDGTVQPIARSVGLFTTQIYGGVPQARQVGALQKGVDIIIGTPGRIEDLHRQGRLDLSAIDTIVLDEADHMCELGFLEPVQRILRLLPEGAQKLLFSATLDTRVAALVDEFLQEPSVYEVAGEDQASSTIDHRVLLIEQRDKRDIVTDLVDGDQRTIVFTRTRAFAEEIAEMLEDRGIRAVALHGDLNQAKRTRNLERLTSGRVNVLVATDVAARGIHVDDIALVVQADAPEEYKTYLHRAGRTGRAGKEGTVVTLVPRNRRRKVDELLGRAEIEAEYTQVQPGDEVLAQLAGR